jgi:hypothetical protein
MRSIFDQIRLDHGLEHGIQLFIASGAFSDLLSLSFHSLIYPPRHGNDSSGLSSEDARLPSAVFFGLRRDFADPPHFSPFDLDTRDEF